MWPLHVLLPCSGLLPTHTGIGWGASVTVDAT